MTTIAYKDGIIAYDSRISSGDTITNDNYNKMIVRNGVRFFVSGQAGEYDALAASYFIPEHERYVTRFSVALVVDSGKVFHYGCNSEDGHWLTDLSQYSCYSIGSGADHAFTAMDLGCSAKEAVRIAANRDMCTGGRIRTYKVKAGER
jgi:ATP-dependent protease HslVU (ClpYQ) peptidase subunit